jgi:sporulation protein YlmC with PRC-barrel domain
LQASIIGAWENEKERVPLLGLGIAILALLVLVGVVGSIAHADQPSEMIGKPVKNLDGKHIGTIEDLVINWGSDGYSEYAVLSFGGFLGLGDEYVAVPWGTLTLSENKEHFVLSVKEEQLKNSPGFLAYRFYDRSSAIPPRDNRSTASPSARVMKNDSGLDVNVSVARSFSMQYPEAEFHR